MPNTNNGKKNKNKINAAANQIVIKPITISLTKKKENSGKNKTKKFFKKSFFRWASVVIGGGTICILSSQLETQRIDQRAWVSLTDIEVKGNRFYTVITNTGKTPANEFKGWISFMNTDDADKINGAFQNIPTAAVTDFGQIAPGRAITISNTTIIQPVMEKVENGDAKFTVLGKITYVDIFGIPHWTEYCRGAYRDFSGFSFVGTHNQTDKKKE